MDDKLARLKEIGFTITGYWKMVDGGIVCELNDLATTSNVLYAFAVDEQLMYVGKTIQALRVRLAGYRNPSKTQSTNIKNNRNIRDCLAQGKRVEIYVLPDNGLLHYGGFHLNLAAGLEDSLVLDLEPPWNGGKKESLNPTLNEVELIAPILDGENEFEQKRHARPPSTADFHTALLALFSAAVQSGSNTINVNAGQLHRRVGGYPGNDHRMPVCCDVMRKTMRKGDTVVAEPPKGKGASLTIRYSIPRLQM